MPCTSHPQNTTENPIGTKPILRFVKPDMLHATEEHDCGRVVWLRSKILNEGYWTKPVLCLKEEAILLDGHHRLAVAKSLGLAQLPVIWINKDDENLKLSSWREGVTVQLSDVIAAGLTGKLFAKKTTRFTYATPIPNVNVSLKRLLRSPSPLKAPAIDAPT